MQEENLPSNSSSSEEAYNDLSEAYPLLKPKMEKTVLDVLLIFSDEPLDLTDENKLNELILLIKNNPNIRHISIKNRVLLNDNARTKLEELYRNNDISCQLRYDIDKSLDYGHGDKSYQFQRFLRGLAARNQRAINKKILSGELKAQPLPLVNLPKKSPSKAVNVRRVKLLDQNALKKLGGKQVQQQQAEQQEQAQQQQRQQRKQSTRQQAKVREELYNKLQDRLQTNTPEKATKDELGELFSRSMLLNEPEKFTGFRPELPGRPDHVHSLDAINKWEMDCIISYWDNLVGNNAHRIADPTQKIELIQKEAFEQMLQHPDEFSYGLNLDNLPLGFYIREITEGDKTQTVLCYSKAYVDQNKPTTPLAPTLRKNPIIQPIYHPVEFFDQVGFDEITKLQKKEFRIFPSASTDDFKNDVRNFFLYPRSEYEKDKNEFHEYFKNALKNEDPESYAQLNQYYENIVEDFNYTNFKAITYVFLHSGTQGVLTFVTQLAKLKESGHYDQFKKVFLDNAINFNTLNTFEARQAIDQYTKLTPNQLTWWNALSEQHMKNNPQGDFTDLWKGFNYFLEELEKLGKSINKPLELPSIFPFEDVKHMKVGLDRLLVILNRSLDPAEQIKNLQGLDLDQYGAFHAHRYNEFLVSTPEMRLEPDIQQNALPLFPDNIRITIGDHYILYKDMNFEKFKNDLKTKKRVKFDEYMSLYDAQEIENHKIDLRSDSELMNYTDTFDFMTSGKYSVYRTTRTNSMLFCHVDSENKETVMKMHVITSGRIDQFLDILSNFEKNIKDADDENDKTRLLETFRKVLDHEFPPIQRSIPDSQNDLLILQKNKVNYSCALLELYKNLSKVTTKVRDNTERVAFDLKKKETLQNLDNQAIYFYRYIAQQPYALSSDQYKSILNKIASLNLDPLSNANLLILIAQATTGKKQLQTENIILDIDKFFSVLRELKENKGSNPRRPDINAAAEQLSLFIESLWGFSYNFEKAINSTDQSSNFPSIKELTTLFELNDYPAGRIIDDRLSSQLKLHTQQLGENAFKMIQVLYNRAISFKPNHRADYATNIYAQLNIILNSKNLNTEEKGLLDIISLSVDFQNIDKFQETQTMLCNEIANIDDPEKRLNILKALATIDVVNTDTLPFCEKIIEVVKAASENKELTKFVDIFNFISDGLPEVKFNKSELSEQFKSILDRFPPLDFHDVLEGLKQFLTIDAQTEKKLVFAGEAYNSDDSNQKIKGLSDLIKIINELTKHNPLLRTFIEKLVKTMVLDGINKDFSAVLTDQIDKLKQKNETYDNENNINYIDESTLATLKKNLSSGCPMIKYSEKLSEDIEKGSEYVSAITGFFILIDQLQEHNIQQARFASQILKAEHDIEKLFNIYNTHQEKFSVAGFTQLVSVLAQNESFSADYQLESILNTVSNEFDEKRLTLVVTELAKHKDSFKKNYIGLLKFICKAYKDEDIERFIIKFAKIDSKYQDQLLSIISHPELKISDIDQLLENFSTIQGPVLPKLVNYVVNAENCDTPTKFNYLNDLCSILNDESTPQILQILDSTHFQKSAHNPEDLASMLELAKGLKLLSKDEINEITTLYQSPPSPTAERLLSTISTKPLNIKELIAQFEKDPTGQRSSAEKINAQFDTSAVDRVLSEMEDLLVGEKIPQEMKLQLIHEFTFINAIGKDIPISTAEGQNKSLIDFTTKEVQALLKKVQAELQNPNIKPQERHQKRLLYLALLREAMYRTTGKFPYSTQILSVLTAFSTDGNTLLQINTGEGKTLINALNSAMGCAEGRSQIIPTSNLQLAKEGLEENHHFYEFLGHKATVVEAGSEKATFIRGGINYTDPGNISLYLQQAALRGEDIFEGGQLVDVLIDEADFAMLDERQFFNFSMNLEGVDTHHNPHAWIYPLINDFIKTETYKELCSPEDDVMNLRRYIYSQIASQNIPGLTQEDLKEQLDKLSFKQLNRWIDSAVIASSYEEGVDFVIGKEKRMVNGKMAEVQVAHIVNENGSISTESKWSKGVHQFVHARLNFPIDAEMGYVSSETSKSFLDNFKGKGRIIGTTGTAGSAIEIEELRRKFNLSVLKIPPHKKNLRQYLQPSFGTQAKFAFTSQTQLRILKSALDKSSKKRDQQPVLIICKDITSAKEMAKKLEEYTQKGYTIQVVTGEESSAALDEARTQAAKKGVITISTPIFSRGTDIKTQHNHGLFVIQTYFDRFRMTCQILGRAARDGLIGYYQPIYNVEEIAAEFGISLKGKTRKQKIALLEKIQVKLDKEAQMERKYSHHVGDINNLLQKQLNLWFKKIQSTPELKGLQKDILKIKEQFIADLEEKWNELLEKSDPNAEYPNPFIRYDQSENLCDEALVKCVKEHEEAAAKLWNEAQLKIIELVNGKTQADYCEKHLAELLQFNPDHSIAQMKVQPESTHIESASKTHLTSINANEANTAYLRYYSDPDPATKNERQLQSYINQFKNFIAELKLCKIPTRQGRHLHKALMTTLSTLNPDMSTAFDLQKNISDYTEQLMDDYLKNYAAYAKAGIKLDKFYELFIQPLVNIVDANPSQAEVLSKPIREQLSDAYFKAIESGKIENASLITDLAKLLRHNKLKNVFEDEKFDEKIYNNTDQMALLTNLKMLANEALSNYREQLMQRPVSADRIEACKTLEKEIMKMSIENLDDMLDKFNNAIDKCFESTLKSDIEVDQKREKITGKAFTRHTVGRLRPLLVTLKEISHSIRPVQEKEEVKDFNSSLALDLKDYESILKETNIKKRNMPDSKQSRLKLARENFQLKIETALKNPDQSQSMIKFLQKNKNHPLVRKSKFDSLLTILPKLRPKS